MSGFSHVLLRQQLLVRENVSIVGQHQAAAANLHTLSPRPDLGLRLLPAAEHHARSSASLAYRTVEAFSEGADARVVQRTRYFVHIAGPPVDQSKDLH